MTNNTKQSAIVWLTRNGFFLYSPSIKSVINLPFTKDTVDSLEVIDEIKFEQLIQSFINFHKLPNLRIYLIVGPDSLIEEELLVNQSGSAAEEEKRILDSMPFENVYSRKWVTDQKLKIAGFNAGLYNALKTAFEKSGWQIESVTPYFVVGQNIFNEEVAQSLLKKVDTLVRENIINTVAYGTDTEKENEQNKQVKKSSLPLLLGIFFCLIIVLIILLFSRSTQKPTPASNPASVTPSATPTKPPISPTEIVPTSTSEASLKNTLKIKILTVTDKRSQAETVKNQLNQLGYKNIVVIIDPTLLDREKNFFVITSSLSPVYKEEIFSKLKQLLPEITVQNNNSNQEDVTIKIVNIE